MDKCSAVGMNKKYVRHIKTNYIVAESSYWRIIGDKIG